MSIYLFKYNISDTQKFIFQSHAKGALLELKKRSDYVQNITDNCLKKLKEFFSPHNVIELYSDYENFVIEVITDKNDHEIAGFIKTFQSNYLKQTLFPHIAFVERKTEKFNITLSALNKKLQKTKLHRSICFEPFETVPIQLQDIVLNIKTGINGEFFCSDFDQIAQNSEGDKKMAALKIDVDNLAALFHNVTEEEYKKISKTLKDFFDEKLWQLIKDLKMQQHIFCVYSGCDRCFFFGNWSKIFELAIKLRQKFEDFQRNLKIQIPSLPDAELSISAGIVTTTSNFPLFQWSEEVEKALYASKCVTSKNSVTVFGKTLLWHEFIQSQKIANQLVDLIRNKGETKSLINRIKSSDVGFDELQQNAHEGKINIPKVWRLKYYLRNVKTENEEAIKTLFEEYTNAIMDTFMKRKTTNPNLYPVAARWAELLLR